MQKKEMDVIKVVTNVFFYTFLHVYANLFAILAPGPSNVSVKRIFDCLKASTNKIISFVPAPIMTKRDK